MPSRGGVHWQKAEGVDLHEKKGTTGEGGGKRPKEPAIYYILEKKEPLRAFDGTGLLFKILKRAREIKKRQNAGSMRGAEREGKRKSQGGSHAPWGVATRRGFRYAKNHQKNGGGGKKTRQAA